MPKNTKKETVIEAAEEAITEPVETIEEPKTEDVKTDAEGRDAAFYKRHPGAIPGVIYE